MNQVVHEAKTSRLGSVPENGESLGIQRLANECRNNAPVVRMHPRPVGVENTQNSCVYATRSAVGRCYRFCVTFSLVVDASRSDRVDVAPILLSLGVKKGFTINFTTRGEDESCGFAQGEIEHVPHSLRPGPQGQDGPV